MMRIEVDAVMYWTPAQHCFVRFAKWPLDNHPFTISSVHEDPGPAVEPSKFAFLVRPLQGFTSRLLKHVEAQPLKRYTEKCDGVQPRGQCQMEVTIDGPYGGMTHWQALHQDFDQAVLIAGGSGISAMLPWILKFASMGRSEVACRVLFTLDLVCATCLRDLVGH